MFFLNHVKYVVGQNSSFLGKYSKYILNFYFKNEYSF